MRSSVPAYLLWPLLLLVLLAAAWLRLHDLGQGTLGHIESYTPGIIFPEGVSDPPSRVDQRHNMIWAINDVHGPFWYLWMLPLTRVFGTSLVAMRLPGALLGIGAVALAFLVARRIGGARLGLASSALLAVAGHHLYWSRQARFYSSACFFAVLSTWLLLRVADGKGRWPLAAYLATTLAGLATIYYYWPVAILQLVWMVGVESRRGARVAGWQLWAFVAAAPLVTLAVYQARPGPYLAYDDWRFLGGYYTFGFLLEPAIDAGSALSWVTPLRWILPLAALLCLALGLRSLVRAPATSDGSTAAGPPTWLVGATACLSAAVAIWGGALGAEVFPHKRALLRASVLVPLALAAVCFVLRGRRFAVPEAVRSPLALAAMLALLPALGVAAISQAFPFYAPRGMLCYTPFLLILAARGVLEMARPGVAIAVLLAVAALGSVRTALADPGAIDYGGLARQWLPQIEDADRIFIAPHWSTTPELYYLQGRYDQIVGRDWQSSDARRAWAILVPGAPQPVAFLQALEQRERTRTLRATGIGVALFEAP